MDGKRQNEGSLFGSAGFYIALLLCVVVAGAAGGFLIFGGEETVQPTVSIPKAEEPVINTVQKPVTPSVTEKTEEPEEKETPTKPAMVLEEQPTAAPEEPKLVSAPLVGETVAVFSGEELQYNETVGDWRTHDGMDIAAPAGTPVAAAQAGTVQAVETGGKLGTVVVLTHADGYETTYASLEEKVLVEIGDTVTVGQELGTVGNTTVTESALGAHLHFAVTKDGKAVDPQAYLNGEME